MQKDDSVTSARTGADSSTKVENMQSSSHDTKPNVVGSPSLSESYLKSDVSTQIIVDKILKDVSGLSIGQAKRAIRIASHCVNTVSEKIEAEQVFV